jgi:glycosyltransferase involved in cell wall biosynthesis
MKKKVLIIATSKKARGGINSVIRAYSQTDLWNKWRCYWLESHIDTNYFMKFWFFFRSIFQFLFLLPTSQIVHIHFSEPPSAFRKLVFFKLSRLLHKKVIAHFHSYSTTTTIDGKSQNLYSLIFRLSDIVFVLSESWKKWITEKWPEFTEKLVILYNPCVKVDSVDYRKDAKTILFAGALIKRKGYSDLINGFASISGRFTDWKVIFAGNGEIERAKQMATDLNVSDQIEFKGWVEGEEKDKIFRDAALFCLPSYAEGFPMAVLDAWSYGLPVITTPVGGLPDILVDRKNAIIIRPGEPEDISKALTDLITNEEKRIHLSQESLKLSKNLFSLDKIVEKLDDVYTFLTKN